MSTLRARRRYWLLVGAVGVGLWVTPSPPAGATSSSGNQTIFASVVSSCIVGNATLNFGTYAPTASSTSTTTIAVTCNYGTVAKVALDEGLNSDKAASYGERALANNGHYLGYDIYSDPAHLIVWDRRRAHLFVSDGSTKELTAYGMIPAGQTNPHAGNYSDLVSIVVTF